jgi:hypothetical protein
MIDPQQKSAQRILRRGSIIPAKAGIQCLFFLDDASPRRQGPSAFAFPAAKSR